MAARNHLGASTFRKEMYLTITEARLHLIAREFEESAIVAKNALQYARKSHSQQGIGELRKLHAMLGELAPMNPHICNLGIELGIFPRKK